jgi:hypothetical protein
LENKGNKNRKGWIRMIYRENNINVLEFGTGDICVVCIGKKVDSELYGVGFLQTDPIEIGKYRPEYDGITEDEFKPEVKMTFSDIRSIDVVIDHLQKVKDSMEKESNNE